GLAITAQVIDPQAFVLGGGVAKNGEIVAQIVKENYEKYVMFALKDKVFRLAELGNDAGIYGAARMVMIDD
ncbi:MAG: ROK family protein, partial [Paludibacteraceae bacterium]|nr:ROK family protein [Paludibacteraceae bacterium]